MVLRSTFDLRVPRGTRAARISAHFAFWSFTRSSGATTDLLLVSGPTALLIDVFVNRCVSCSHARPRLAPRELALHLTSESTLHLDPCRTLLMPPHGRERGARGLYVSEHPVAVPSPQEEIKDATQSIRRSAERRPASGRIARARRDSMTSTGRPPARSPKSWQRIAVAPRSLLRSLRPRARRGGEAASSSRGQDGAGLAPKAEAAAQDRCQLGSRQKSRS